MAFASGKNAWGISDRSGRRYRLRDMKKEWTGALVGPDEYEPKHPQLYPPRPGSDPQALRDPRPDTKEKVQSFVGIPLVENPNLLSPRGVGRVGQVSVVSSQSGNITVSLTGEEATSAVGSASASGSTLISATYNITVPAGIGGGYYQDGARPGIDGSDINEGSTYRYDQSDVSNTGHPLRFSTTPDGTHGGGVEYTTGVTYSGSPGLPGAYTQITVAIGAPTLYTYCSVHSGMGYKVNTL